MKPTGIDSRNNPVRAGDTVRWRSSEYVVAGFIPHGGRWGCQTVVFETEPHSDEVPDECSIDLVAVGSRP